MTHLQCLELEFVLNLQVHLIGSSVTFVLLLRYCCVTQRVLIEMTREIPREGANLCNLHTTCVKFRRRLPGYGYSNVLVSFFVPRECNLFHIYFQFTVHQIISCNAILSNLRILHVKINQSRFRDIF